jgi:hypothetical protein
MSSIVDISTPENELTCVAGTQTKVRFKISGKLQRRISIGATVVTHGRLQSSWLRLDQGEMDRLDNGEVWDLVLTVTVPSDAAAAQEKVSIMIYDMREPSEHFDESSAVSLTIQAAEVEVPVPPIPVPTMNNRRNWILVFFAAIITAAAMPTLSISIGSLGDYKWDNDFITVIYVILFFVIFIINISMAVIATRNCFPWWFCILILILPGIFLGSLYAGGIIIGGGVFLVGCGILAFHFSRYAKKKRA